MIYHCSQLAIAIRGEQWLDTKQNNYNNNTIKILSRINDYRTTHYYYIIIRWHQSHQMHHDTVLEDDTIIKKSHVTQTEIASKPFDRFRGLYLHFLHYTYNLFECGMLLAILKLFQTMILSSQTIWKGCHSLPFNILFCSY